MSLLRAKTLRGIRIAHSKNTENSPIVDMPLPPVVSISMQQHLGSPCRCIVKKGDRVLVGQLIGEPTAFLAAPIHSSVSGTVKAIDYLTTSAGEICDIAVIETDGAQEISPEVRPPVVGTTEEFIEAVKASGLVGLGGAGFPTWIKLKLKPEQRAEYLLVNAAECEPYITSDYRTMLESPQDILAGMRAVKQYVGVEYIVLSIEANKPEAIREMRRLGEESGVFSVHVLSSQYPSGGEKVILDDTLGRIVPEGGLPIDVGAIVMNVASVAFLGAYLRTGMPLVQKVMTVDGRCVREPKNVRALIGTPLSALADFCGGLTSEPGKVLMGGPMMGTTVYDIDTPVIKNNNAVLFFDEKQSAERKTTACIRCGRCIAACPVYLMPAAIEKAYAAGNGERLDQLKVNLCMECGCCSYVCPAKRELVQVNKLAKKLLREKKAGERRA